MNIKKIFSDHSRLFNSLLVISLTVLLNSCALADLRPKEMRNLTLNQTDQSKGRALLERARIAQGFDEIQDFETYTVNYRDSWRGLLGRSGNPWPVNGDEMTVHYEIGSFDSRAEVLEGKKTGLEFGMQSWNTYLQKEEENLEWKASKKRAFVLAATQYFFEMANRLSSLPVITYAGQRNFEGVDYELVLASWGSLAPDKEYDQYLLYINPETDLIELTSFTIRDNYLPSPSSWYGTIHFENWAETEGFRYAQIMSIQVNKPKNPDKKWIHQLEVSSFAFDQVDTDYLRRNPALPVMGDSKPLR